MELVSVRTETDYTNLLRQLLPPGPAWEGEEIQDLIAKLAKEMARTDQRIYALFSEMDPNTVTELVPEWEKVMNLPDPCLGEAPSFSDRVRQVRERLAAVGSQTPAYFVSIAKKQGYENARVIEIWAPRWGRSRFGKAHFGTWLQQFFWILETGSRLKGGRRWGVSYWGERFGAIAGNALDCIIHRYSPAHTIYNIVYPGDETNELSNAS